MEKSDIINKLKDISSLSIEDKCKIVDWYIDSYPVPINEFNPFTFQRTTAFTALVGATPVKVVSEKDKELLDYTINKIKEYINE